MTPETPRSGLGTPRAAWRPKMVPKGLRKLKIRSLWQACKQASKQTASRATLHHEPKRRQEETGRDERRQETRGDKRKTTAEHSRAQEGRGGKRRQDERGGDRRRRDKKGHEKTRQEATEQEGTTKNRR